MTVTYTPSKRVQQQYKGFKAAMPLWKNTMYGLEMFELPKICSSEYTLQPILETLFIGKRAELFLEHILLHSKRYTILAKNIQIIENKNTLGELDFIVFDTILKQTIHLEQVYKFYTYDPIFKTEQECWIGPNRKDSLKQKIEKLKTHQLPLLYHNATQNTLKDLHIHSKDIVQKVCFTAHCFLPIGFKSTSNLTINLATISGDYLSYTSFMALDHSKYYYHIPKKIDWSIIPNQSTVWHNYNSIASKIKAYKNEQYAILIWIKKDNIFSKRMLIWW